ncbi:iduronate 2-sulfatase isoform X2 [Contarinia nasturtii]|uniref:iduronate 2-sulfatase isoform X2 n=1 Tax=Contarinia nasturtii TaxID=265458 RepID=UPI0012D3A09F|nr:iduronate 2-sulfatase isoform X2 [Contarinia nasturtii]
MHSYWRTSVGNFTTIPQYFKEHGYKTYSIGKVFHPGASSNFNDDFPFSWSNKTYHPSTEKWMNDAVCYDKISQQLQRNLICPVDVNRMPLHSLPDIQSIGTAKQLLSTFKKTSIPFFIAIGLHKPHIPFRFPSKYLRYHDIDKFKKNDFIHVPPNLPTVAFNPYNDIRLRDDVRKLNISFPFGPMVKSFAWHIRQAYYAAVTYVDDLLGDLLQSVDFSNTIILLTSDHGYSLGEHAEFAKYTNFEIGVRVPLIIYSPEYQRNATYKVHALAELVDIFPTLVELATLPTIKSCRKGYFKQTTCTEGKSLVRYFSAAGMPLNITNYQFAISQYPRPGIFPTQYPDSDKPRLKYIKIMGYSLRTIRFRYTIWLEFNPKTFKRNWHKYYGEELYDHSIDPEENLNLVNRHEFDAIKLQLKHLLRSKLENN